MRVNGIPMSSFLRKLAVKAVKSSENPQRAVFSTLVCLADGPEVSALCRQLFEQVQAFAKEVGEKDLVKLMAWLRRERRGYSAKVDGPSPTMQLLDNITALEDECLAAVERLCVPDGEPDHATKE